MDAQRIERMAVEVSALLKYLPKGEQAAVLLAFCDAHRIGAVIDVGGRPEVASGQTFGMDRAKSYWGPPERPAGDTGSAATRVRLALEGLSLEKRMNALVAGCRSLGIAGIVGYPDQPSPWLIGDLPPWTPDRRNPAKRADGGHVSAILARVVDLLAQCSGDGERCQVLSAAAAFHALLLSETPVHGAVLPWRELLNGPPWRAESTSGPGGSRPRD